MQASAAERRRRTRKIQLAGAVAPRQHDGPGVYRRHAQPWRLSALQYAHTPEPAAARDSASRHLTTARHTDENSAMQYIFGAHVARSTSLPTSFQMLEITNLETARPAPGRAPIQRPGWSDPRRNRRPGGQLHEPLVNRWQQLQTGFQASLHPNDESAREKIQVVAWSDPSDVLTWRVPNIGNVDVVNLYVQNAPHWFWLFESPTCRARRLRQKQSRAAGDVPRHVRTPGSH